MQSNVCRGVKVPITGNIGFKDPGLSQFLDTWAAVALGLSLKRGVFAVSPGQQN